jgi:predicted nucleic acid-binding protein
VILVDTSLWIHLLNRGSRTPVSERDLVNFVTCGPIVQEVLQGMRDDPRAGALRHSFLSLPLLNDPLPRRTFVAAADLYRLGREKGYTIRSSIDCLIAAIAIENDVTVWHKDRDYEAIARYSQLRAAQPI